MAATILIADDDAVQRRLVENMVQRCGYDAIVVDSGDAAIAHLTDPEARAVDALVLDLVMPGLDGMGVLAKIREAGLDVPVIVQTAHGGIDNVVSAMRAGAHDFVVKPVGVERLQVSLRNALNASALKGELQRIRHRREGRLTFADIVTRAPAMTQVIAMGRKAAASAIPVLIEGESGVGKELIARAIHGTGERSARPFVTVNCGAIPDNLVESILFGHEKGAFTGASQRATGRFEQAEGGTLFLDEIGDMPMEAQTRLLRVLQQGEYTTVGGRTPIKTDVRIVAATNRDLRQLINLGLFREDLFYRLNVVPIRLPPLHERTEDIPDLVRHFLAQAEQEGLPPKTIDSEGMELLKRYRWPGNVRELENLVRRLAALYTEETIGASILTGELAEPEFKNTLEQAPADEPLSVAVERSLTRLFAAHGDGLPPPGLYDNILREVERPLFGMALAATRGNQIKAAHLLGINRNTLRKKLKDLDVQVIRGIK